MTPLVAANWKMNGSRKALQHWLIELGQFDAPACERALCVPDVLLGWWHGEWPAMLMPGAQNCHHQANGAFTGNASVSMLKEASAQCVIVGHSERRQHEGESDTLIAQKAITALQADILPIMCLGESLEERESGQAEARIKESLDVWLPLLAPFNQPITIAYEPIWAIGTGLTPSLNDIDAMHRFIREQLRSALGTHGSMSRILYGGSVKGSNAIELASSSQVDGFLVGGASLNAAEFHSICQAFS